MHDDFAMLVRKAASKRTIIIKLNIKQNLVAESKANKVATNDVNRTTSTAYMPPHTPIGTRK